MQDTQQIQAFLKQELTDLKSRIASNIRSTGRNATGRTIDSLEVQVSTSGAFSAQGVLLGRKYFGALETGSRPWKGWEFRKRVPSTFADRIQEWIDAKGLDLNAYAVAYNIIHSGTALFRQGGRPDVYSNEIPGTLDKLTEKYATFLTDFAYSSITLNTK